MRAAVCAVLLTILATCASAGVVTWNTYCHTYQSPGCFSSNGPPGPTDDVVFPAGTNVIFFGIGSQAPGYTPFFARTLNISKGATVEMTNNEYAVLGNIFVDGTLILNGSAEGPGVGPIGAQYYPPQAEQINAFWLGGFTPRVIQQVNTRMTISGTVRVFSGYSSLWSNVIITATGTLDLRAGAQLIGTIDNAGTFIAEQATYIVQPSVNHVTGRMKIGLPLAQSFFEGTVLNLRNDGYLHFTNGIGYEVMGVGTLINTGTLILNVSNTLNWAGWSIVNSGNIEWILDNCTGAVEFHTPGYLNSLVNSGTVTVCGAAIYATSLVNNGGHFVLQHGGSIQMGAGSGTATPRFLRYECEEKVDEAPPARSLLEARQTTGGQCNPKNTSSCPKEKCCDAEGVCQPQQCLWFCCASNDPCNSYMNSLYCPPSYGSQERPPSLPKCQYKLSFEDVATEEDLHAAFAIKHVITNRYAFFGKTTISGDGTGFLLTTEPVQVYGSVDVLRGASWHQLVEFQQPTTVGGGIVTVHEGGRLVAGIDAVADRDGRIDIRKGGFMLIPRHAHFAISNATAVQVGGTLHVDGELRVGGRLLHEKTASLLGEGIVRTVQPTKK